MEDFGNMSNKKQSKEPEDDFVLLFGICLFSVSIIALVCVYFL